MLYLVQTFSDCKILFIWRDLLEVASSFNVRAQEGKAWIKDWDYRHALNTWHSSLESLKEIKESEYKAQVKVIQYEHLFSGNIAQLQDLYQFLDLSISPGVGKTFQRLTAGWSERSARKPALRSTCRIRFYLRGEILQRP